MKFNTSRPPSFAPFLVIGIAFLAMGVAGNRVFLGVGAVFLAIGAAFAVRSRQSGRF